MSNGFIYVVEENFIDKIGERKKSWTQVPVELIMMSSPRHILKKFLHLELPDNSEATDRYTGNRRRLHKINQVTLNCVRLILAIDGDSYDHRHLMRNFCQCVIVIKRMTTRPVECCYRHGMCFRVSSVFVLSILF
jgi:hypothetical protein